VVVVVVVVAGVENIEKGRYRHFLERQLFRLLYSAAGGK
jgi:hypothetical protein